MFEIKDRAAAGRLGKWTFGKHTLETPTIAIVVNPNKLVVPPEELKKEFGADLIITNAYIIKNSKHAKEIEENGIHAFYKWNGPIYFDSGTFQMYSQGDAKIGPEETIEYQQKVGADVITPLDLFTLPTDTRETAEQKLHETSSRVKSAREVVKTQALNVPIQGGMFLDLRKKAAHQASKVDADIYSIGGIVPLMEQYRFKDLVDVILTVKQTLDPSKPVHAFGAGHPMMFSLLVALGIDVFDSAAYALYASADRYMTPLGTKHLHELKELPCSCPVCSSHKAKDLDEKLLARHNLYVTFAEIRAIKQAITEGTLWELVESRIRAHPSLVEAYRHLVKYKKYLEEQVPVGGKSALFELGTETKGRPEVYRVKQRTKLMPTKDMTWLGIAVPSALSYVYPVGQSVQINDSRTIPEDAKVIVKGILSYQYGPKAAALIDDSVSISRSRKTNRIRHVMKGDTLLGTIRASDGMFVPSLEGAKQLLTLTNSHFVVVNEDSIPFVKQGKSVFAKFVLECDKNIRPFDEVFILSPAKEVIGFGTALMNKREMSFFKSGAAVTTRSSVPIDEE